MILAGADARPITPDLDAPVFLAGFQANRRATAADADLEVRTLALAEPGGRPFVLSVCDLIGIVRADTLAIRLDVSEADVVIASTHTHSGPDTIGLWGPDEATSGTDDHYLERVRAEVLVSIHAALGALVPVHASAALTSVQDVIRNSRDPDVVDDAVGVLVFDAADDGRRVATVVNVGVHPEVLDGSSTVVSPDLAGATRDAIDRTDGGITVWASGDLGGMQSPAEGPRTPEEARRKASVIARAALEAPRTPVEETVRYRHAEVRLPLWNPRFRAGLEAGLLRGQLRPDGALITDVGVLRIGVAVAACWPGEVLPRLGMTSKARLQTPFPFVVGLANDELGYILPDEDFVAPEDWDYPDPHYEESMSVGPHTGSRLLAALDDLLEGP